MKPRTKHIDVKYHHFRSHVAAGVIDFKTIKSGDQPADILTKPLCGNVILVASHNNHGMGKSRSLTTFGTGFQRRYSDTIVPWSELRMERSRTFITVRTNFHCLGSPCCLITPSSRSERECGILLGISRPASSGMSVISPHAKTLGSHEKSQQPLP
jgi:hypothetical protein